MRTFCILTKLKIILTYCHVRDIKTHVSIFWICTVYLNTKKFRITFSVDSRQIQNTVYLYSNPLVCGTLLDY